MPVLMQHSSAAKGTVPDLTFWGLLASPFQLKMQALADAAGLRWQRWPEQAGTLQAVAAYRRLAKKYHPDRYRTFTEQRWATRRFIRVREAYETLLTSARREERRAARPHADAPFPDLGRVSPWTTPGETAFEIEVDPFVGYRTLVKILLGPLVLLHDSRLSRWLTDRGWEGAVQLIVGVLVILAFPGAAGLACVLLPVLLVHTLLLGIGAILDRLLAKEPGKRRTVIGDLVSRGGVFFLLEMLVGGGLLALILFEWFGRRPIGTTEVVVGVALWIPAAIFLLVEAASFVWTTLLRHRLQ